MCYAMHLSGIYVQRAYSGKKLTAGAMSHVLRNVRSTLLGIGVVAYSERFWDGIFIDRVHSRSTSGLFGKFLTMSLCG